MTKVCFKCHREQDLECFYAHPEMKDGHLNKCKDCTKKDVRLDNGLASRKCLECGRRFQTTNSEVKRGGGVVCSRECYYKRQKRVVARGPASPYWKGDRVGNKSLHMWVAQHRGKPKKCDLCGTTKAKRYEWANKSQEYRRDLSDWLRLCVKCHTEYDRQVRTAKWKATVVKRYGWNVTKI